LMTYRSESIRKHASPSPVPILSKGAFEDLAVHVPQNKPEQMAIAAPLDAINRKIALIKKKQLLVDKLYGWLVERLTAGRIRLSDLNLSALPGIDFRETQ